MIQGFRDLGIEEFDARCRRQKNLILDIGFWILDQGFNLLLVTGIEQIHLTRFVIKKTRHPTQNP
jgi:hypothetical protein